ncbi:MAG TPA: DsbA family oxidoreductase [Anaerolineales bacterium]|nr:DsbA family oxidoreductase [Anaerolineales bacterium]
MDQLKLTIYSDYVCPWCYVGQGVVATLIEKHSAQVEWRPFYLRPDTPPEGMELPDYVKSRMAQTNARLKQMADAAGLEMVFATRIPNTRLAHEATEYATQNGKHMEFHRVVFDKFYGRGEDISKWDVLRDAAVQVGLDADEMQREVEAGRHTAAVNSAVQEAQQIGVTGVPTYVLNDRYAIVGAQPYEAFLQALRQIEKDQK